jgi:high-affinity iron transporter
MIFWMRGAARTLARELHGRLESAVAVGGTAVVLLAFVSVAREGIETSVFFWTAAKATGSTWTPVLGFSLGIATAIALGVLLYRSAVTINLATFFRWTGLLLVFVAAGVLAYGVHDLQEAGALPGLTTLLFDVSEQIPPGSWYGTLLSGLVNFSPATTVLQAVVWVSYVVPTLVLYLRPVRVTQPVPDAPVSV